jgi:hypothetical protein
MLSPEFAAQRVLVEQWLDTLKGDAHWEPPVWLSTKTVSKHTWPALSGQRMDKALARRRFKR